MADAANVPRLLAFTLAALTVAALAAPPAGAIPVRDQHNPVSGSGSVSALAQDLAQTFVPSADGRIPYVDLHLSIYGDAEPEEPLVVELRTVAGNVPTDRVLARAGVSEVGSPRRVTFPSRPAVRGGTPYALTLSASVDFWMARFDTVNAYASGAAYWQPSPPAWTYISGLFNRDLAFTTYLDPVTDAAAPATTLAPSTSGAAGWWRGTVGLDVDSDDGPSGVGVDETRCWIDPPAVPATFDAAGHAPCPATLAGEGDRRVWVASADAFGNGEVPHEVRVRIDDTPPVTQLADGPEVPVGPVTLLAEDPGGSGVAATYYEIGADPALPTAASPRYDPTDRPVLGAGERIRFLSVDAAGNAEANATSRAAPAPAQPEPPTRVETRTIEVPGPLRVETRAVPAPSTPPAPVSTTASARLGSGRTIRTSVGCGPSACRASVTAEVRVGKRVVARVKAKSVQLAAGKQQTVKLMLTKAQRKKAGNTARVVVVVRTEGASAPSVRLG